MAKLTHKIFDDRVKGAMSPGGVAKKGGLQGLQAAIAKMKQVRKVR